MWVHPQLSSSLLSVAGKHYLVNPGLWTKRRHGRVFKFQGSIKKNWLDGPLRNFAGRFQMGQTRRVLSGGIFPRAKFLKGRQSEKTLKNVVFDTSELAGDGGAR